MPTSAQAASRTTRIAAYFDGVTYVRELPTGGFEFGTGARANMLAHGRCDSFIEAEQGRISLARRLAGTMMARTERPTQVSPEPDLPCRYDGFLRTDINDCCLRCGAADGEDCKDI